MTPSKIMTASQIWIQLDLFIESERNISLHCPIYAENWTRMGENKRKYSGPAHAGKTKACPYPTQIWLCRLIWKRYGKNLEMLIPLLSYPGIYTVPRHCFFFPLKDESRSKLDRLGWHKALPGNTDLESTVCSSGSTLMSGTGEQRILPSSSSHTSLSCHYKQSQITV